MVGKFLHQRISLVRALVRDFGRVRRRAFAHTGHLRPLGESLCGAANDWGSAILASPQGFLFHFGRLRTPHCLDNPAGRPSAARRRTLRAQAVAAFWDLQSPTSASVKAFDVNDKDKQLSRTVCTYPAKDTVICRDWDTGKLVTTKHPQPE